MQPTPPERQSQATHSLPKAAVVPFERPQTDLQSTIRRRVQERLDHSGVKAKKLSPLRLVLTLVIALIPVALTFGSADAVLRRIQLLTRLYTSQSTQPAETPAEPEEPGVLLMMPDPALQPSQPETTTTSPSAAAPAENKPLQKQPARQ